MSQRSVLLVGSSDLGAGVDCDRALAELALVARVEHVADLSAAAECLADRARTFELVVLCESRRGQVSVAALDGLRRLAPLCRFWRLAGSWHEGEQRSGQPPAGCLSSYWHQWQARSARALAAASGDRPPGWTLPLTSSADERGLAEASEPIERRMGTIVICAGRFESAAALADSCRLAGYDCVTVRDGDAFHADGAVAVVWDTTPARMADAERIAGLRRCTGAAPLVAVVGFPRADEVRRALQAGVAAVVSKPYWVRDLLWQVAKAARPRD